VKSTDQVAEKALQFAKKIGIEKFQVSATESAKKELNLEAGRISLLRSTKTQRLNFKAIQGGRVGFARLDGFDDASIELGVQQSLQTALSSPVDTAHDIAPVSAQSEAVRSWAHGPDQPNLEKMWTRLEEMIQERNARFPKIVLEQCIVDFDSSKTTLANSNGVFLNSREGAYGIMTMFTGKDGKSTSSFNYTHGSSLDLEKPLLDHFLTRELFSESSAQIHATPFQGQFKGKIILTPYALQDMLSFYLMNLRDGAMIAETSVFRGKLEQKIASELLTITSEISRSDFAQHEPFNGDGFVSQDMSILKKGVLQTYLLSQYGAAKTSEKRALNGGSHLVVEGGAHSREDLISSVDRGLLVARFSGRTPSPNGDFSGVAKNSFLIENGKIGRPVSETMISGNLVDLFLNIERFSRERLNTGSSLLPWMASQGVMISGSAQ
jgi:PmbA protein